MAPLVVGGARLAGPETGSGRAWTRAKTVFLAEIVKGDGIQAAAGRLGIALAAARTHLRHVFDQTGTQCQAELVGLATASQMVLREESWAPVRSPVRASPSLPPG